MLARGALPLGWRCRSGWCAVCGGAGGACCSGLRRATRALGGQPLALLPERDAGGADKRPAVRAAVLFLVHESRVTVVPARRRGRRCRGDPYPSDGGYCRRSPIRGVLMGCGTVYIPGMFWGLGTSCRQRRLRCRILKQRFSLVVLSIALVIAGLGRRSPKRRRPPLVEGLTGGTRSGRSAGARDGGGGRERGISRETRYLLPVFVPVVLAGVAVVLAAVWQTAPRRRPRPLAVAGVLGAARRGALLRGVPRPGREPAGRAALALGRLHPRRRRPLRLGGRGRRGRADPRDARDRRAAAPRSSSTTTARSSRSAAAAAGPR